MDYFSCAKTLIYLLLEPLYRFFPGHAACCGTLIKSQTKALIGLYDRNRPNYIKKYIEKLKCKKFLNFTKTLQRYCLAL